MYFKYVERGKAVNICQPSTSSKTLWRARDAKANGGEHNDQGSGRQIESRAAVRQAMGGENTFQCLESALEVALRRTEAGGDWAESSTASGSVMLSRRVNLVEFSCLCGKTSGGF